MAHVTALRHQRVLLMRELPDMDTLLSTEQLKPCFTDYEKRQILAPSVPSDRAAKLLDAVEKKDYAAYERFVSAVRPLKPDLVVALETTEREIRDSSAASSPCSNGSASLPFGNMDNGYSNGFPLRSADLSPPALNELNFPGQRRRMEVIEEAGPYGLTGHSPGPAHQLARLSYAEREFLGERLNGSPQDRNLFNNFCIALGVEQRLIQASVRSGNPTAYLLQEFGEKPDATFGRLERALSEIGHQDLYEQLQAVDSRPMYGEDV